MVLHREGLDERAKPLFARALAIEPRHWNAHQGLAEIDRRFGFHDRAAAHYEIALETIDRRADVWRDYAEVLLDLREFRTADLAIRKALELDPTSPDARLILALARRAQGDLDGAVEEVGAALAWAPASAASRAGAVRLRLIKRRRRRRASAPKRSRRRPLTARARLARGDDAGAGGTWRP